MKKYAFILIALLVISGFANSQSKSLTENQATAKSILDKLRDKYEASQILDIDFSLEISFPEQKPVVEKGHFVQKEKQYRLELPERWIISDGQAIWVYFTEKKEVQINDVAEDEEEFTLDQLFRIYEKDDFVYVLTDELQLDGRTVQIIDFKPTDSDSEYFKFRLTVDKEKSEIVKIKSFSKDGTRITVKIDKLTSPKDASRFKFTLTKSDCPDCHFEDLRID